MADSYGQFTLWVSVYHLLKSEPSCTSHKPRASYQRWLVRGDLEHEISPYAATQSYVVVIGHSPKQYRIQDFAPLSCGKMGKLLVYNVTTIIILLICYITLFGWNSLEKYFKKDVIIITEEENPSSISPPGFISFRFDFSIELSFCFSYNYFGCK